ncbi:hypothetical protein HRH25_14085 [Flavisolibacter sp. BT320]|nr:hypothetical protein [Flavisolibacter longurius]
MQTKTFTALLAAAFLLISSCKKEEDKQASKTDLLTSGQWRMTSYTLSPPYDLDGDGTADTDGLATFDACDRDDLFIFKRDGTLVLDEGSTKCNSKDPQTENTTWDFVNNETEIIIAGERVTIVELTQSRFRVSADVGGSTGDITFTKQ